MFGGFKASLDLLSGNKKKNDVSDLSSDIFATGAYRVTREDVYGFSTFDAPKSRTSRQSAQTLRQSKSTNNLVQEPSSDPNLRKSAPTISQDPRGAEQGDRNSEPSRKDKKNQEKEQKKLEKQRLADQKKQAKEQAKQDKLMKNRAKKEAKIASKGKGKNVKVQGPTPPPAPPQPAATRPQTQPLNRPKASPRLNKTPQAQPQQQTPSMPQPGYSTNTLDSSISRSSGPPPYSEVPAQATEKTGNVVFSKPVDNGSWDIISQHREQITRPTASTATKEKHRQVLMDLNYKLGATNDNNEEKHDNSES